MTVYRNLFVTYVCSKFGPFSTKHTVYVFWLPNRLRQLDNKNDHLDTWLSSYILLKFWI